MPIVNGTFQNWTLNLTPSGTSGTSSAAHFIALTPFLLPWLVTLFIIGIYFIMFYTLRNDDSRYKFLPITFVPMFISVMFALIGWVGAGVPAFTVSVFVLTTFIVVATSG